MSQRRAPHQHAQQRDAALSYQPVVEERIVTIYTTLKTPPDGGALTISPTTPGIEQGFNNRIQDSAQLPSFITSGDVNADMTAANAPLVAQTIKPTSSTPTSPTVATSATATATEASEPMSSTSTSSSSSSGSTDVATKAGIALGVLGGLFLILAFVYLMIVRRRKLLEAQRGEAADDEKLHGHVGTHSRHASETQATAPRISLGPMTSLFNFNNASQGDALAAKSAPKFATRPTTSDSSNASEDPFSNHAQIQDDGLAPGAPFGASAVTMDSATLPPLLTKDLPSPPRSFAEVSPIDSEDDMPVGHAVSHTDGIVSGMERHLSERRQSVRNENVPAPLDLTLPPKTMFAVPPSPSGTEFSMAEMEPDQTPYPSAGAASIAADGGPSNTTVHRVQMDFKPTLDDELELQAGQVVRLLHEYDDGWALCIRLDRSQQGVVPRTCLSVRPVKPRLPHSGGPRGPPVNPQGGQRGPGFPPGIRPMGPPTGQRGPDQLMRAMGPSMGMDPRAQSPNGPSQRPAQDAQHGPAEIPPSPSQSYLPGQAY